jgi:hypothetical protein
MTSTELVEIDQDGMPYSCFRLLVKKSISLDFSDLGNPW